MASRHRWVKLRLHVYICRKCGCGKVNAQGPGGDWFATYHRPDGTSVVTSRVPPCATGPRSSAYLAKHALSLEVPF